MSTNNYNYLTYMTARMKLENNLFSSNTSSKKTSSLSDCSFLISNALTTDYKNFSYLDLVNSSIKQLHSSTKSSNAASINKIKQELLESLDTLSFKDNTLQLTDNTKYKVQTLTHGLVGIVTSQLGVNSLLSTLYPDSNEMSFYTNKYEFEDVTKTIKLMNSLVYGKTAQEKVSALKELYPSIDTDGGSLDLLERLKKLGVTPGTEFEIKGCSGKLVIDNNGKIYTSEEYNKINNK